MKTPSIEDMLSQSTEDPWGLIDQLEARFGASPEQRKQREFDALQRQALAQSAATVFGDVDGERVLEWLLDMTWRRLTFAISSHPDPAQALLYGAFREGQNAIALTILRMIAVGREEIPPPQEE